jgi:crotonobetainyl-CoA:carnitine CoA-transferase CaiB-like acyl-CoA transferase
VLIQNFRPGVIERLGLGYGEARALNPRLIYASITGYGEKGPWVDWPGQDLLAQALSGAMWLSGSANDGPVPFGLSVADMLAGHAITEGVLAALVRRGVTGEGALVETSLLEAVVDLQFEVLTTYLNDGGRRPVRSSFNNAHAYLAAPYGVYPTSDGFMALAMTPLPVLADLLPLPELAADGSGPQTGFTKRDEIKQRIAAVLATRSTEEWLAQFRAADVWCAPVLNWPELLSSEQFSILDMLQTVRRGEAVSIETTRSPIRIDGARPAMSRAAPRIGEHTQALRAEFDL